MAKYHVNPETGEPGECKAEIKCRFGSPEEHYTSPEAARKAFEENQPLFPLKKLEETPAQILDRASTLVPGESLRKELYAELPVGTILLQVHNESGDQSYFSIGEDRRTRAVDRRRMAFALDDATLFSKGSRAFYVAESPFENEFTASQLNNAWEDRAELTYRIARALHETWRDELLEPKELGDVDFDELPNEWHLENRNSAESALIRIRQGIANHWTRTQLGSMIHRDWLDRNKDRAPADQLLPFDELSDSERRKDYVVLEAAAEAISRYPKGV